MANTKSAKKAARVAVRRKTVNKARKERVHAAIKKVEAAIKAGKKAEAMKAFKAAQPEIQRSIGKKIMHKNTAARKLSRLSAAIKKLG
jgi:small subunit ribosomal protein S20